MKTPEAQPEIRPNQSIELLKELHILTRDGKLNQDSRRKLKQVYHLVNFIEPLFNEVLLRNPNPTLVDHGAGKSYLGFILYDLLLKQHDAGQVLPATVDIVTALHACNTATDDAIQFGLKKHAQYMVLVPCCQAEVAEVLRQHKNESFAKTPLSEIWRHPMHTREFGSQLTNVLRCLQLEAAGYQVTVTELVGWEHSMKNELIIAKYTGQPRMNARTRLESILSELNLETLTSRFLT